MKEETKAKILLIVSLILAMTTVVVVMGYVSFQIEAVTDPAELEGMAFGAIIVGGAIFMGSWQFYGWVLTKIFKFK